MAKSTVNRLSVSVRTNIGKGSSRRARRDGKVPAVLYGHGEEPQHLELPAHAFAAVLRQIGANAVLTLDIDGKEQLALTKAIDVHQIRHTIMHADLLVVRRGEKVVVEVPVEVEGDAGPDILVTQEATSIEIEAEALSIPEQLTISIEGIEPGTMFTARQIPLPVGVTLVSDPEMLVVNVVNAATVAQTKAEYAGEAPKAPEVGTVENKAGKAKNTVTESE